MSDLPQWALDRAQKWLDEEACDYCSDARLRKVERLAALLVEVRQEALAEVRRVVEEKRASYAATLRLSDLRTVEQACIDEILTRLEALR